MPKTDSADLMTRAREALETREGKDASAAMTYLLWREHRRDLSGLLSPLESPERTPNRQVARAIADLADPMVPPAMRLATVRLFEPLLAPMAREVDEGAGVETTSTYIQALRIAYAVGESEGRETSPRDEAEFDSWRIALKESYA